MDADLGAVVVSGRWVSVSAAEEERFVREGRGRRGRFVKIIKAKFVPDFKLQKSIIFLLLLIIIAQFIFTETAVNVARNIVVVVVLHSCPSLTPQSRFISLFRDLTLLTIATKKTREIIHSARIS